MLRADWELAQPAAADIEQKLIDAILPLLPRADIVLLSDYAKGVLTARVIRNVIDAARKLGKRVIVDPKSANFAIYRGATLLTPNRKEFAEATRSRADTAESIADAAQDAMQLADCEAMLVTQSEHGMTLVPRKGEAIHVPAHPVKVRDVSGAGDTVAAVLAVTLAAGADWETALRMANAAAAVAVGKKGTASVDVSGIAAKDPAACIPRGGRKDRRGRRRPRCASSGLAQAGLAGRFHQRLFRYPASRPRQGADRGARRLRSPDRRPEQRCLGEAAEGRGASGSGRARARRSAGGAGGGRSRRHLRGRHADQADHPDQAERAGEGRRLYPRRRSSATRSSRPMAAKCCWSTSCPVSARHRWSIARAEARRERGGDASRCRRCLASGGAIRPPGRPRSIFSPS